MNDKTKNPYIFYFIRDDKIYYVNSETVQYKEMLLIITPR